MSFWLGRDFFDNPIVPSYILCKSNKERIGSINCLNKNITLKFNALDEIQFNTYLYIDGEKNQYYDDINIMKGILLPDIGFYTITSVDITSEGTDYEYKSVTAKSSECLLGQKYLETFTINMGTVESIDRCRFYDIGDKEHSLLHLVLSKANSWEIGHIDEGLKTMERSFQIDRQDIYSFLTVDVAEAFECIFVFDTLNNKINIYKEENYSKDTNVYVSFNNLMKSASVSYSDSNVKTCLTLIGADDLNIREINLGFSQIFNMDYYHSTEFMSKSLYVEWGKWVKKRSGYLDTYTTLLSEYQDYIIQINDLTHNKMPDDTESTDWTKYGLVPLEEKLATYEQRQSVMMKSGWGNKDHANYNSHYLPVYNTINAINAQIKTVTTQIDALKNKQSKVYAQMSTIINDLAMENNFTDEQLKELDNFIREDELTSDNYVVTSIMSDEERFEMLDDFLKHGEKELAKHAVPQLTFTAEMSNLFSMEEFSSWYNDFNVGNYIHVSLRDDYIVKPKLLEISFDFLDLTDFNVTFGNVAKYGDKLLDITEAVALAQSAATSVSFNSSYWNEAAKETDDIGKMIEAGLVGQGNYIKNGDDNEFLIDRRGLFVNTTSGEYANKDSIFIGGGRILFTDDNWKTVAMAVGRADVNGESRFGVFADFLIAGYVGGSTVEGSKIIGGTLESTNYQKGKYGTYFDLTKGTFEFNSSGEQKLTLDDKGVLTVKGTIKADLGYIGGSSGFTIKDGKLYSGNKSDFSNTSAGVYIGTDGIALGANNAFSVTSAGALTAKSGTIGGIKIESDKIRSKDNDNFTITSGGQATFKHVTITGVQQGSTFGNIGYDGKTTWGTFGGGSSFSSNVSSPFGGTCVGHIQSISANYISTNYLSAIKTDIEELYADVANVGELVVGVGERVTTIEEDYISTGTLKTKIADIGTLTVGGYSCKWREIKAVIGISTNTSHALSSDGKTPIVVVTNVSYTYRNLYILAGASGEIVSG